MKKIMHPIAVEVGTEGSVIISQAVGDLNERDPEITISAEQAPLVAAWIYEASQAIVHERLEEDAIPVRYFARGPEAEAENLEVFKNNQGMIILKIDDDTFIEVSPAMAKRLRDQLSRAIRSALTEMLRPDADA